MIAAKLDQFLDMGYEEFNWVPPMSKPLLARREAMYPPSSTSGSSAHQPQSSSGFMGGAFSNSLGFSKTSSSSQPSTPIKRGTVDGRASFKTSDYFDSESPREPSTYLFEMITFLTAYVDSVLIGLREGVRGRAYRGALEHVKDGLIASLFFSTGIHMNGSELMVYTLQNLLLIKEVAAVSEQALKNLLDDVLFVEKEMKNLDLDENIVGLEDMFSEITSVSITPDPHVSGSGIDNVLFRKIRPSA